MMREQAFIEWIREQRECDPAVVPVGPGDDCAVVTCGSERLLVTVDEVLDGVHFRLERDGAEAAGRKAMARGLSDIAAMAGEPLAAVASVSLPKGFSRSDAEAMYRGRRAVSDRFNCPMIGGDIATWTGPLAISVTVLGRPGPRGPILRSGAKVGDAVCVTGSLGGAWKSDRHLTFTPRVAEALAMAKKFDLHAMIDISDGLARDLHHICEASNVGAQIVAGDLPVHPEVLAGSADRSAAVQAALGDGEDYELLFALPPDEAAAMIEDPPIEVPITRVGSIVRGPHVTLITGDGRQDILEPEGWEHTT